MTLTPVEPASMNVLSNAVLVAASSRRSAMVPPHELLTTEAPPVTAVCSAASRLLSKQSCAPTYTMCAPGAIACTDSTSSACSAYQPLPPQTSALVTVDGWTLVNCDDASGWPESFSLK